MLAVPDLAKFAVVIAVMVGIPPLADSGHLDQPIRPTKITDSGDLDHAARLG